ncbi:purine and uridine phosphorylase [Aspergillus heterothallicus]
MSPPSRDEFQIDWICALPVEAAAAQEMLDENFGILHEQSATDPNIYTLGQIGKHNIAIACLPAGQYGATAAAITSLKVGLLVGVGGGIPSAEHDVRLGDVVISCPTGTCGGVVRYDMGKRGNTFKRTGSLNSPPRSLLVAVNSMRTAAMTDEGRYLEYIQGATMRNQRTQKTFGRPGRKTDRLFKAAHEHPSDATDCTMCPFEWEEVRIARGDDDPQAHYGIIASGNSVMRDANARDRIGSETGAWCVEMEASGLMLDFPCIVIRGICDYSDSHKNKEWQGYAALVAAAYTKELLQWLPQSQIKRERLMAHICRR